MRRRPLTSEQRRQRQEREAFPDRNGVPFALYHTWLPPRVSDWPLPPIVKDDKDDVQGQFHQEFRSCWWCGYPREFDFGTPGFAFKKVELHHLAGGSRGRSHERFLFTMLCSDCHDKHAGPDDLGFLLYLKWKHDPEGTDWPRTALRLRRFLPDLITERP